MKKRLYQVYDLTAQMGLGPIMTEFRDGPAIRHFTTVLGEPNTMLNKYPEQYELRYIGNYDEEASALEVPAECPRTIVTGAGWAEEQRRRSEQGETPRPYSADRA